jgi:hypothetical protein
VPETLRQHALESIGGRAAKFLVGWSQRRQTQETARLFPGLAAKRNCAATTLRSDLITGESQRNGLLRELHTASPSQTIHKRTRYSRRAK